MSTLLRIPRETRDEIYGYLFSSISIGDKITHFGKRKKKTATPNGLAILRTCGQINQEVGTLWVSLVSFNYKHMSAMLERLQPLPQATLSKMRYIYTRPFCDQEPQDLLDTVSFKLLGAMKTLPSLRLETLTMMMWLDGDDIYDTLDKFIKYGTGWKELRIITNDHTMSRSWWNYWTSSMIYTSQPSTWERIIRYRDGADSEPSINIYRSIEADDPGAVLDSSRRESITYPLPPLPPVPHPLAPTPSQACPSCIASYPLISYWDLRHALRHETLTEPGRKRDVIIIVKRGQGINIAEKARPYLPM